MIQMAQVLSDQGTAVWEKLSENPDKVYFPNFGDGDNALKSGIDIDRVMFTIPGTNFKIYWYGFLIALGIILALIYGFKKMKKVGIDPDRATDVIIGGFFGAIICARLYYIVFSDSTPITKFFDFRDGGLAIYGGLIGAILVGGFITMKKKLRFTAMLDVAAPCFLIGQAIGRWGNFFNQECFGTNTDKPWGMLSLTTANYVKNNITDGSVDPTLPIHPCFLYESLWCIAGFILIHLYFKHRKFDGEMILGYAAWYGLGRFFIEGLRTDSLYIGSLRASQLLAGLCFVASVIAIIVIRVRIAKTKDYVFFKDTELSREQLLQYENAKRFDKERKELKNKIAKAKADGEDTAELEKEYEEQFGETAKKKQALALAKAEEKDLKAAAERKAARGKAAGDDDEPETKPETKKEKSVTVEAVKEKAADKTEEKKNEVVETVEEKFEETKTEVVETVEEKAEETKTEVAETVEEKAEETKTEVVETVEEKAEETKTEVVETVEEKTEETKTEVAETVEEKAEETKTEDKPKQNTQNNNASNGQKKNNNNNRNRNNRNRNRSKNRSGNNGGNKQGGQNNNKPNNNKQGTNKNNNKNNSGKSSGNN